jgi:hypothetical protein
MTVSLCRARALVLKWKAVVAKEEREREEQERGEQQEEEEEDELNHHQEEEEEDGQDGVDGVVAQGKPTIGSIFIADPRFVVFFVNQIQLLTSFLKRKLISGI